jgi:hypothetical protein
LWTWRTKKKFFYSACIIKEHIIIIKQIGKMFNLTTCSPELFAVVLSIVVPIPGAIVVVVVVVGTCVVVVVGSSVVVVEAEDILDLN